MGEGGPAIAGLFLTLAVALALSLPLGAAALVLTLRQIRRGEARERAWRSRLEAQEREWRERLAALEAHWTALPQDRSQAPFPRTCLPPAVRSEALRLLQRGDPPAAVAASLQLASGEVRLLSKLQELLAGQS